MIISKLANHHFHTTQIFEGMSGTISIFKGISRTSILMCADMYTKQFCSVNIVLKISYHA